MRKRIASMERARAAANSEYRILEVKLRNEERIETYREEVRKWKQKMSEMGFWGRLLNEPPRPNPPEHEPIEPEPPPLSHFESLVDKSYDFSQILIETVASHHIPHTQLAPEFVNKQNVRDVSTKLLEAGRAPLHGS
jgi:hypothetical protein